MFKVGLTGGIGSGKTTIANLFAELGVPIVDTDQIARDLVAPHTPAWQAIVDHFAKKNSTLLDAQTQEINRKQLRHIIFNHPDEKKWLENLLHPLIREEVNRQVSLLHSDYCILMIPLLFENQYDYQLNRILVVTTSLAQQIKRVVERDQVDEEQVQKIIAHQVPHAHRMQHADDVLENNDNSLTELRQKVLQLHQTYLTLSQ